MMLKLRLERLLDAIEAELKNSNEYDREKMRYLIEKNLKHCVCFQTYDEWRESVFGGDKWKLEI